VQYTTSLHRGCSSEDRSCSNKEVAVKNTIFKMSVPLCLAAVVVLCCAEDVQKTTLVAPTTDEIGTRTFCPVTRDSFTVHEQTPVVQYKGERYYMCCPGCATEFMREPDKYIKQMGTGAQHTVAVDQDMIGAEVVCPVSGDRFLVSETTPVVEYKGTKYYLCCPECELEFKKDPEKYIELMDMQPEE
jgi:YHS domain-containing protein